MTPVFFIIECRRYVIMYPPAIVSNLSIALIALSLNFGKRQTKICSILKPLDKNRISYYRPKLMEYWIRVVKWMFYRNDSEAFDAMELY